MSTTTRQEVTMTSTATPQLITLGSVVRVKRGNRTSLIEVTQVQDDVILGWLPYASTYEKGGQYEGSYRGTTHAFTDQVVEVVSQPDPQTAAQAALAATPTAELLTAAYALTHRIHEAETMPARTWRTEGDRTRSHRAADDLRAQRDLITAEVLRRTGGQ